MGVMRWEAGRRVYRSGLYRLAGEMSACLLVGKRLEKLTVVALRRVHRPHVHALFCGDLVG